MTYDVFFLAQLKELSAELHAFTVKIIIIIIIIIKFRFFNK